MGTKFNEDMKVNSGIALRQTDNGGGMSVRNGGDYQPLRN